MTKDPWTDPDPQPEDFDEYLANLDPRCIEWHPGNPNAKVTLVEDDDRRVVEAQRLAAARRS